MSLFKLDERLNHRYEQLLGKDDEQKNNNVQKSFIVEGKVGDPWLEDLEWILLNDLKGDYEGIKINEAKQQISFLFIDDFARHKAINIIKTRFKGFNINPIIIN